MVADLHCLQVLSKVHTQNTHTDKAVIKHLWKTQARISHLIALWKDRTLKVWVILLLGWRKAVSFFLEGDWIAKFVSELADDLTDFLLYQQMPQSLGISSRLVGGLSFFLQHSATLSPAEKTLHHPLKVSFRERFLIYYPYLWIFFFFPVLSFALD